MARGSDSDEGVWSIPAPRTKGNREHRVPLCRRALEILEVARALSRRSPLVFPSRGGKPIATTMLSELLRELKIAAVPHGFRLRFRDGAAEETDHPRVVRSFLAGTCAARSTNWHSTAGSTRPALTRRTPPNRAMQSRDTWSSRFN